MREGSALGEWSPLPAWHLPMVALVVALCLVPVGLGAASLIRTASHPAPEVAVETRVAGAVVERSGTLEPAPVDGVVVMQVSVTTCGQRSVGSAVLVDDDLVLTAAHVVGDAALVRIDHRGAVLTGEVLGVFADGRDLALIELEASMLEPLTPGRVPATDEAITVAGHPGGGPAAVVVGPRVPVPEIADVVVPGELVAVAASTPPGVSGGPALDADGRLFGVLVATELATDTGIITTIGDPADLAGAPLVDGRCPTGA